jgi:hypothetical protein
MPPCLQFRGKLYAEQMRAVEELTSKLPRLRAGLPTPLPNYDEFEARWNVWN